MNASLMIRNLEEAQDFARGCTFFGTGGGGDYKEGVEALKEQLELGNTISCVDVDSIEEEGLSCCPFLMGSIAPDDPNTIKERKEIYELGDQKFNYTKAMIGAVKSLEEISNRKIQVLVPIELGGANTASCIAAAAETGRIVIDGDYTGRAIPEIQQTTPYIYERELLPIASFDCWGNTASITKAENWRVAERIGKMIAAAGYSKCAQAGFLLPLTEMKETIIKGTLSQCMKAGRTIREAREHKLDPAEELVKALGGKIILRGEVSDKEWEDRNGYYWGMHTFTGEGSFAGDKLKIWFKNENHISWLNDELYVTSPDMLQVIETNTGEPLTNNHITIGQKVTIIAMPARKVFRTERGLRVLSPKAFGYNHPYRTFEEIVTE